MPLRFLLRPLFLAAVLATATPAFAATIIGNSPYDAAPSFDAGYYYTYGFDYAGYGNGGPNIDLGGTPVDTAFGNDPAQGTGGSGAVFVTADATDVPAPGANYPNPGDPAVQYSYWGFGGGNGLAARNPTTSAELSEYVATVDLRVVGLQGGSTGTFAAFEIEFQATDGTLGGALDGDADILLKLQFADRTGAEPNAPFVTESFQTFTFPLDRNNLIMEGDPANLATYGANLTILNLNFNFNDGAQDFGLDAGNAFYVDNASIVQIPEPSAAALFLVALAVAGKRRRR